jgi:HlyD family secretion protein
LTSDSILFERWRPTVVRKLFLLVLTVLSSADMGLLMTQTGSVTVQEPAATVMQSSQTSTPEPIVVDADVSGLVAIRPPASIVDALTAAGTIELISKRQVVLQAEGTVSQVAVREGQAVAAGDLLIALDTTDLQRAVSRAELDVDSAKADLQKLHEGSSQAEIDAAEANLKATQENLARVQAGPTQEEIAAAQSRLAAAQAKYSELQAPPSSSELDEVKAELEKADISRQAAQRAYDQIKWRNDKGMTQESAELYKATVEYERVQAKYDRINQGAAQSSVQDSVASIRKAQSELEDLKLKPSAADVAEAQAKVSEAEQRLAKLVAPPPAAEVEAAEAKVKKAELDVAEAKTKLGYAQVVAPIDGTVLELSITAGERGTVGKVVATLADTSKLKLTVKVAEVDITKIQTGQVVEIAIDAIRGRTFAGVIDSIAPINQADKDVVNYPVTIQLTDTNLDGVRPGMNAVVTLTDPQSAADGWLVPTTALKALPGGQAQVLVQRGEELAPVTVVPGAAQGEWTLVQSPDLHEGDKVQGSVTSYVDQQPEPGQPGASDGTQGG